LNRRSRRPERRVMPSFTTPSQVAAAGFEPAISSSPSLRLSRLDHMTLLRLEWPTKHRPTNGRPAWAVNNGHAALNFSNQTSKNPIAESNRCFHAENVTYWPLYEWGMGLALGLEPRWACLQNRCIATLPHQQRAAEAGIEPAGDVFNRHAVLPTVPPPQSSMYQLQLFSTCMKRSRRYPYTNRVKQGRTDSNRVSKFWRLLLLPGSRPYGGLNGARIRFSRSSVAGITAYAINPKLRLERIELTSPAWQASVLPLHHRRKNGRGRNRTDMFLIKSQVHYLVCHTPVWVSEIVKEQEDQPGIEPGPAHYECAALPLCD
jgi:hypothetical protein